MEMGSLNIKGNITMASNYTTYEKVGDKESFSNDVSNITPVDLTFSDAIGTGGSITNTTHQWQTDEYETVGLNTQQEGWEGLTDNLTPTTLLSNVTQILAKKGKLSDTAKATRAHGHEVEEAYQREKTKVELMRDLEHTYVGTGQTKVTGDNSGPVARQMDGFQAQVANTVDGGANALTEVDLKALLETMYLEGAQPKTLMINPLYAETVAAFTGKALATSSTNNLENADTTVNSYVDTYISQFGEPLSIVNNRYLLSTQVLVLDTDMVDARPMAGRDFIFKDLETQGSTTAWFCEYEGTLEVKNPKGQGVILNVTP